MHSMTTSNDYFNRLGAMHVFLTNWAVLLQFTFGTGMIILVRERIIAFTSIAMEVILFPTDFT